MSGVSSLEMIVRPDSLGSSVISVSSVGSSPMATSSSAHAMHTMRTESSLIEAPRSSSTRVSAVPATTCVGCAFSKRDARLAEVAATMPMSRPSVSFTAAAAVAAATSASDVITTSWMSPCDSSTRCRSGARNWAMDAQSCAMMKTEF